MDWLLTAVLFLGMVAAILAYLTIKQDNKAYRMYFFVLTMIMIMSGFVLLTGSGGVTVTENVYYANGTLSAIHNTTLVLPDTMTGIPGADFEIILYSTFFFVFIVVCFWIMEVIGFFGSTAGVRAKPGRYAGV